MVTHVRNGLVVIESQGKAVTLRATQNEKVPSRFHAEARRIPTKIYSLGGSAAFTRWVIACCDDFMDILRASAPPREPIAGFNQ